MIWGSFLTAKNPSPQSRALTRKVPGMYQLPIFPWERGDFSDYELADVNARISAYLLDHEVRFLDLLPAFRRQGRAPAYFTDQSDWHPNVRGHEVIANAVFRDFEQRVRDADRE